MRPQLSETEAIQAAQARYFWESTREIVSWHTQHAIDSDAGPISDADAGDDDTPEDDDGIERVDI